MPPPSTFLDHLLVLSLLRAIALFLSRVNRRLSTHSDRLVEVGEEVREKSVEEVTPKPAPAEAANDSEQTTSPEPLIHKTTRRLVTPLTPETEEIIRQAARYGLLLDDELSLLPQKAAA